MLSLTTPTLTDQMARERCPPHTEHSLSEHPTPLWKDMAPTHEASNTPEISQKRP